MARFLTIVLVAASSAAFADTPQLNFHSFEDGNIYTKPYTGLKGSWNEELGYSAPLVTTGQWTLKYNVAYIQTWPLKTEVEPQWTAGATIVYQLSNQGLQPGLYTKIKSSLDGLWQQETGLTAKYRMGQYGLIGNAGYVLNYPHFTNVKPRWQVGVSFAWYLK